MSSGISYLTYGEWNDFSLCSPVTKYSVGQQWRGIHHRQTVLRKFPFPGVSEGVGEPNKSAVTERAEQFPIAFINMAGVQPIERDIISPASPEQRELGECDVEDLGDILKIPHGFTVGHNCYLGQQAASK